jgi:hypothetical protein
MTRVSEPPTKIDFVTNLWNSSFCYIIFKYVGELKTFVLIQGHYFTE